MIHEDVAEKFLPRVAQALEERHVELRGDERTCAILGSRCRPATVEDWDTEYNDYILTIGIVDSLMRQFRTSISTARIIPSQSLLKITVRVSVFERNRFRLRLRQCFDPFYRWVRIRIWSRNRHCDAKASRKRTDGLKRADHDQIRDSRRRSNQRVAFRIKTCLIFGFKGSHAGKALHLK